MDIDFSPFFKRYEAIAAKADRAFSHVKEKFPEEVKCTPGCADCCFAMFDLTLIEAMYLNHHFKKEFTGEERERLLEKANKADRQAYKIKKAAYESKRNGEPEDKLLKEMAQQRIRCPLLNDENMCELYSCRPIACRVYGIPLAIGGKGHTCGHSGFEPGKNYPTFNLDVLHDQLLALSAEFIQAIGSKHVKMGDVLVPVSMALLTEYDEEYLGLKEPAGENSQASEGGKEG